MQTALCDSNTQHNGVTTLAPAPGTWVSVYLCEALMAVDPWSILALAEPSQ